MSIAQFFYEKTSLNAEGAVEVTSGVTVGAGTNKEDDYERFVLVITELEAMETDGLIAITYRHQENQTGKKFIDLVKFRKLK